MVISDYKKATNEELRIAVAKAQGWRVEYRTPLGRRYPKYSVLDPDGNEACQFAQNFEKKRGGTNRMIELCAPPYPDDLMLCWRLFDTANGALAMTSIEQGAYVTYEPSNTVRMFEGRGSTPQRALMRCYLAWKGGE